MNTSKNPWFKIALVLIVVSTISLGVWGTLGLLHQRGKIRIEVQKMPQDTTILVNGKKAATSPLYLAPGTYKITGQREGFKTYDYNLDLKAGDKQDHPLYFVLTPVSDAAKKWATDHARDYAKIERNAGTTQNAVGEKLLEKYPIAKKLPYRGDLYNIDYFSNESGEFRVQINSPTPLGRQVAIETIKKWGYEPTDYVIEFVDLANPFAAENGVTNE